MVFKIVGPYIKLGQLLKATNLVELGSDAKEVILNGEVIVNGAVALQRGKKIVPGDSVQFNGEVIDCV
ncbi:MAG: RNA-binding S4 domain-containing protein [Lachnospiraceae bacterium]|nr:RNA-binding S4 domain-containing protein [Lachnospiraceae bacterium]